MADALAYAGSYHVTDSIPGVEVNVGKLVLSPTRTYAPIIVKVLQQLRGEIHGMVHCSGGAQTKVLHFIENLHVVKDNLFEVPPLFSMIQQQSDTDWKEMYKVFNMGHRMEVYLPQQYAEKVIAIAKAFDVEAKIVGRVESAPAKKVTLKTATGEFVYQ